MLRPVAKNYRSLLARGLLGAVALLCLIAPALAQVKPAKHSGFRTNRLEIHVETQMLGRIRRLGESQASDQGFKPWPHVDGGQRGTIVHVHASLGGGGFEIMTYPMPSTKAIVDVGNRLAADLGKPLAELELRNDVHYGSLGLNLDKYVTGSGSNTTFDLNLSRLATALQNSPELTKPISIWIDNSDADSAQLETGSTIKPLGKHTFYRAEALAQALGGESVYHVRTTVTWVTWLFGCIGGLMVVSGIGFFATMPWQLEKARRKADQMKAEGAADASPEEIQRKYDEAKKKRLRPEMIMGAVFVFIAIVFSGGKEYKKLLALSPLDKLNPALAPLYMLALIALGFGVVRLVYALDVRRRAARDPAVLNYVHGPKPDKSKKQNLPWWVATIPVGMVAVILGSRFIIPDPGARQWVLIPTILVSTGLLMWAIFRSSAGANRKLGPDESAFQIAQEFAKEAGVKLRNVQELSQVEGPNASMSLSGTLSLTKGLLTKLEPDEIRAVIAHEIGHRKARHVQKLFPLSVLISIGVLVVFEVLVVRYREQLPDGVAILLNGPIVIGVVGRLVQVMFLGKRQLQYEREADLFAVKATGDPELVIRALTKIHDLNKQPHRLTKRDELLSAHPSLENRIKAIREANQPPIISA